MSINVCSYKDCMVRRFPCSSTAFFAFPNDEKRRSIWIKNSGNRALENLLPNKLRFLCENHFDACDIRVQFNRKILRRCAVPRPHKSTQHTTKHKDVLTSQQQENDKEGEDLMEEELENYIVEYIEYKSEEDEVSKEPEVLGTINNSLQNIDESDNSKLTADSILTTSSTITLPELNVMPQDQQHIVIKKDKPNYKCSSGSQKQCEEFQREELASDKHFALSLVHYFQRLNPEEKSIAKLRILSYLTNLEFGGNGSQSCINCQNCKNDLK